MLIEIDIAELNLQMQLSIIEKQFNLIWFYTWIETCFADIFEY